LSLPIHILIGDALSEHRRIRQVFQHLVGFL
jgi:hypothetical protein